MTKKRVLLIAGPTASGKSAIAATIAAEHNAIIVNADSIQVFRELRILSARPSANEEKLLCHRLYGHVRIAQPYSVAQWLADVGIVLKEQENRKRLVIIVGGTGLYFKALTEGLSPIPEIPDAIRQECRSQAANRSSTELYAELHANDPNTAAQLRPTDKQRIVRALEVYRATGLPLAHWQQIPGNPLLPPNTYHALVVTAPRADLYATAEKRFNQMMDAGALKEAAEIHNLAQAHNLNPRLPGLQALGLRPLRAHHEGHIPLDEAVDDAKRETRNYIKRQETWLRRYNRSWDWLTKQETERKARESFAFIDF